MNAIQSNRRGTPSRPSVAQPHGAMAVAACFLGLAATLLCGGCPGTNPEGDLGLPSVVDGNNVWTPLDSGILDVPDLSVATIQGEPLVVVLGDQLPASMLSTLRIEIETAPTSGVLGAVEPSPDGQFTVQYTPPADFVGLVEFTYRAIVGEESSSASTVSIRVYPRLYFDVTPLHGTSPLTVRATAYTLTPDALPEGIYSWRFGVLEDAGPMASHRERSFTFRDAGVYAVTLTCTLAGMAGPVSCSYGDSTQAKIQVISADDPDGGDPSDPTDPLNKAPVAVLGSARTVIDTDGDGIVSVLLDGRGSYDPDGHITQYLWFDHATPLAQGATATVDLDLGSYKIVLRVKDDDGVTDSATQLLEVAGAPDPVISGHITDGHGAPLSGVVINGLPGNPVTNANGDYSVAVLYAFSGTAMPQKAGFDFTPATRTYTTVTKDQPAENYTGSQQTWTISGEILDDGDTPIPGVTLTASGGGGSDATDAMGRYALDVPHGWSGAVTPVHPSYGFAPSSRSYASVTADKSGQDYTGSAQASYAISGRVTDWEGNPYPGVAIRFTGSGTSTGMAFTATTLGDGTYTQDVPTGWSGTVSSDANYRLDPASRVYISVSSTYIGDDFVAYRNYYVDQPGDGIGDDGSDTNPGTYAQPFATIQQGGDMVQPGDTVIVHAGTYDSGSTSANAKVLHIPSAQAGLPGKPITFRAASGETVVIDGGGITRVLFCIEGSYVEIEGFELINAQRNAVQVANYENPGDVSHVNVRMCHAHHNDVDTNYIGGAFVMVGPVWHCSFEDCVSNNNAGGFQFREYPTQTASSALVPPDGMSEAAWDAWDGWTDYAARYCSIRRCLAYDNLAIDEHSDGFACRYSIECLFEDNIAYRNADDGYDMLGATRCTVRRNIAFLTDPELTVNGDGNGIKIGVRGGLDNVVYQNISFSNPRAGIDMADTQRPKLYNNTCYDNTWFGIWFEGARATVGGITALNNVCKANDHGDLGALPSIIIEDFDYNSVADDNDHNWAIAPGAHGYVSTDPGFFDESLVPNINIPGGLTIPERLAFIRAQVETKLGLAAGSLMIDSGCMVGGVTDAYGGSAPDRGAIERP